MRRVRLPWFLSNIKTMKPISIVYSLYTNEQDIIIDNNTKKKSPMTTKLEGEWEVQSARTHLLSMLVATPMRYKRFMDARV